MWKCFRCETINEGEVCVVCGEKRPAVNQQPQERMAYEQVTPSAPTYVPTPRPERTEMTSGSDNSIKLMTIVLGVMAGVMTLSLLLTLL